jgi:hypothetical protein
MSRQTADGKRQKIKAENIDAASEMANGKRQTADIYLRGMTRQSAIVNRQ